MSKNCSDLVGRLWGGCCDWQLLLLWAEIALNLAPAYSSSMCGPAVMGWQFR